MSDAKRDAAQAGRDDLDAWRETLAQNAFETDPFAQGLFERLLPEGWASTRERLLGLAHETGPAFDAQVRECNRDENLPKVRRHDELGHPVESVAFHPAHHEVGRVFWGSGVLSELANPGRERLAGALDYLLCQHGEAGHACPVACTAGAIKLIQLVGSDAQKERYLPPLLDPDYDRRLHAAQFVTEVQGGSDVGLNVCTATPDPDAPGHYRIAGEKWFCSVADAGVFVVSARVEDGGSGTRGLGLFLVPREVDGRPNGFELRRLKYKLGTRSMPTGEIEFAGARAEAIGPTAEGFRNLVSVVLDTSRVHNAIAACGLMRRAFRVAHAYAQHRRAFGAAIGEFPSTQETLARMKLRSMVSLASTFWILDVSDRIALEPDPELAKARRLAVMINKYRTAIACTATVRDAIEVLGGNGTIEDFSVLPRLYRDAIVLESWEGTHNTLCAQVLRDMASRGLHEPWLNALGRSVDALDDARLESVRARASALLDDVKARISSLLDADPRRAAAHIRYVVDHMGLLTDWVTLATQAQWEVCEGGGGESLDALALYESLYIERVDPQRDDSLQELNARLAAGS